MENGARHPLSPAQTQRPGSRGHMVDRLRQVGSLSLYHMAKSRFEIENQGFNDAKNRYGFEHTCHHEQNSVLLNYLLTLLALTIERLYRIRFLSRYSHRAFRRASLPHSLGLAFASSPPQHQLAGSSPPNRLRCTPPTAINPAPVASADWQIPVRKCTYLISLVVISSRLRLYVIFSVPIHPSSEIAAFSNDGLTDGMSRCQTAIGRKRFRCPVLSVVRSPYNKRTIEAGLWGIWAFRPNAKSISYVLST
jgi:hypothetical protein